MIAPAPVTLEGSGVRLEPLASAHLEGLTSAAADGRLWELWYTAVPLPDETAGYIDDALEGQRLGTCFPGRFAISHPAPSSAARGITTSWRRSIASRSATPGTPRAGSAPISTPPANCSCSPMRSRRSDAGSSDCGRTTSTSARNGPSRRSEPGKDGVIRHH